VYVQIVVMDKNDNVWWELPDDVAERLLRAETTNDYAIIGRMLQDALKNADEQASRNP
jgi:hypothetical protein